ncbi:MAG: hypothetical protein ABEJ30_00775 [Halorientalis sp.]
MLGPSREGGDAMVTCIACGDELPRADAREYDKHGDRWDRADKDFEYLCKGCHRDLCHQPRDDLEALLVESGAGVAPRPVVLERFCGSRRECHGSDG